MKQSISKKNAVKALLVWGLLLVASGMIYVMEYFSAIRELKPIFLKHEIIWLLINVIFVYSLVLILYSIIGRAWVTIIVSSAISLIWSIADYYTVIYHGAPLFPHELANFKTAMDVAGGYSFAIDSDVIKILCVFFTLIVVALITKAVEKEDFEVFKEKRFKRRLTSLVVGVLGLALAIFTVVGPIEFKPKDTMGWSWKDGVLKYGFLVCSLESVNNIMAEPYMTPEGYSVEKLKDIQSGKPADTTEYPDIIVILNETFYDLDKFYEINPDVSVLDKFYSIDNAAYGYAPSGGGTNDTEYELLLSNSLFLLNNSSPFNFVNLKDRFSVVKYFGSLGYMTTAMHCGDEVNYHRNVVYRDMEFDNVFLGGADFKYQKNNFNRKWLDSENYKDMLEQLDDNSPTPQFLFLLTYQNHGGYAKNDDSLDTVHSGVDYGDKTSEVNEFMSSIKLSSDAFYELIKELENRRPTVVVMVGDHGPTIERYLTPRETEYDTELASTLVPYVIWTNYKDVPKKYGQIASVEALVPIAVDVAGLPLSPYYSKILELHDVLPLRNIHGKYIDANGKEGEYAEGSEYYDILNEYYCMEYNSLADKNETIKELFWP